MDDAVILTKRKNKDLAFILRANVSGKVDSNIPKSMMREDDDRCFAPGVSFEIMEAYLKCEKGGDYQQQKGYENSVLRLNNPKTIYGVEGFFQKATKINNLRETYHNSEQQKEIEVWDNYLKTMLASSKK